MSNQWENASLQVLGYGDAIEKFDHELRKAIENCRDQNTDTKTVRVVKMEVKLTPDSTRQKIAVKYQASSRLSPDSAGEDHILINMRTGKGVIDNAKQMLIEDYDETVSELPENGTEEG